MKSFSKFIGVGVIAASLAVLPLTVPAQAQNNGSSTYTQQNRNVDGLTRKHTNGDNDIGWIGLLGLIGLAGLAGRKRQETVYRSHSEPDVVARSGSDYRS